MKSSRYLVLLIAFILISSINLIGQQNTPRNSIYRSSLHATNRGLEHWYSRANGGLETITNVPFGKLTSCSKCHVQSCDTCHVEQGKTTYSTEAAKSEKACDSCHGLPTREAARKNPNDPNLDVHFAKGMRCMDCHTSREIHGDGTVYASMQSPGALDVNCKKCHEDAVSKCPSSMVHGDRLDCSACHTRTVETCFNCHFDTKVKDGKSVSLPLKDILFLVNHEGRVTLGAMHTFIYQNRTMVVFAPAFSHWIMKEGRKCDDCHGTALVQGMKSGKLKLVSWDGNGLKNESGIVPVIDGYNWDFPFLNYDHGQWVLAKEAKSPIVHFSGYATPITKEQFGKLSKKYEPEQFKPRRPKR